MPVKHANEVEAKNVAAGKDTTIQVLISSQEGPNFALRRFTMQKGGGIPRHTNTVEHEQYVLRGRAKIPTRRHAVPAKNTASAATSAGPRANSRSSMTPP